MANIQNTDEFVVDYITGKMLPVDVHEGVRQDIERFLVEKKGFDKKDILVNGWLDLALDKYQERCRLDLVISIGGTPTILFKTARGSIVSRERETLSAARLAADYQIPISVVTNGHDAEILDTSTGKIVSKGLDSIPDRKEATGIIKTANFIRLPGKQRVIEQRILLAYLFWKCPAD